MQAVILAAGAGTRLSPLTDSVPKPMLPVGDRPMLARVADAAVDAGATELVVVVGYRGDRVRAYFENEYRGVPVRFADQGEPTGTADAVLAAREHIEGAFAVLNGDNLYRPEDLSRLFDRAPSVGVYPTDEPEAYGIVSVDGDTVTGGTEKPVDLPPSHRKITVLLDLPEGDPEILWDDFESKVRSSVPSRRILTLTSKSVSRQSS
jgi:bifunctional UDP-N-acetylglucosamine pyrophosphorylase/glucosamine-1-phosphate N-acetyltransferase